MAQKVAFWGLRCVLVLILQLGKEKYDIKWPIKKQELTLTCFIATKCS